MVKRQLESILRARLDVIYVVYPGAESFALRHGAMAIPLEAMVRRLQG